MDLDDILNDVMGETEVKVVAPKPVVKKVAESAEIKPWLASTANVPAEFRDKWTKLVRQDLNAATATPFQASYAYRNWWDASGSPSTNKVLQELVRKAAAKCEFDDIQTAKLLNTSNPITDSESGRQLQKAYAALLIHGLKETILKDPNYSPEEFKSLAAIIS
mmetsp:Transcript_2902/g.3040  ORF Transcript_2902/g.3040 Transcript_2902/m.3040 type:complete len:163 (+) Transcript_2902:123-611(+)|eukprot:CAMPEP_0119033390 /NCGR_PEP_ID=MMETSP1177-20130426/436_1 /TAXON_ID=2985 /ORGANISM="Ochromonas sp, Strain CCMP1899" /LENGTH=162 /DNA_ID=CAMNT_0006990107 /DNA_START=109 /DNA_END=597 /DNA_ORIENTATION=-